MENNNASPWPTGFGTRPWLIQAHGGRREAQTLVDIQDRRLHEAAIPEMQGKICLGCVHDGGWLLMLDEDSHDCFMLSVTDDRHSKIRLPPLRRLTSEYSGTCGVLGSPANFTVVIACHPESEEDYFLLYCRPGDAEWTDLLPADEESAELLLEISGDIVACAGKLYASTFTDNFLVIDVIDGAVQTQLLRTEQEEELRGSYVSYLVASCGDIFSVRIDHLGNNHYDGAVTRIVVYRLDFSGSDSDPTWRRVQSIGSDRAFLVSGDYGISCSATQAQLQGNCVYLVWSSCDCERIYKFCLDDMTVTFDQILPQPTTPRSRAYWVVPTIIQATELKEQALMNTMSNQVALPLYLDNNPEEEQQGNSTSACCDLPLELLESIVSKLSLVERLRFPAVCKSWSKVSNPVEQAKVWPWLMHLSKQDGACKMFDPLHGTEYTLGVEAFNKTNSDQLILRSSMDGWAVVSTGGDSDHIRIINPLTQDIVEPPALTRPYRFRGITFSPSALASPDCVAAFGICSSASGEYVTMETWRHGELAWTSLRLEAEEPFPVAKNNPVYFRGEFYCLGRKGNLGVFNPSDNTWRVLDKPEPLYAVLDVFGDDHEGAKFCYLVELEGCLMSVFMLNANEPPRVFKLDDTKMAWNQVEDIGGAALFLDYRASFGVVSPGAGNGNRIFFPRCSYDGKHAAFYDMDSKKYLPAFYGLKEQLNCVWVVPNLKSDGTS